MEHTNADALSRLPIPVEPATTDTRPELVLLINHLGDPPVTASLGLVKIRNLARLYSLRQGWPMAGHSQKSSKLTPFLKRKNELSLYEGCVLWGHRVVIPQRNREAVLVELHEGHLRMARMKAMARMYIYGSRDFKTTLKRQ